MQSRGERRVGRRRYLRDMGVIAGEDFSPQKARILLMLALVHGCLLDGSPTCSRAAESTTRRDRQHLLAT
jgi:hypothetical protein